MEYVKQRRLFAAAGEIRRGKRIIDVALDYGWETHSGFTKAFCGRFGYAPVLLRALYICDASMEGEREHKKRRSCGKFSARRLEKMKQIMTRRI